MNEEENNNNNPLDEAAANRQNNLALKSGKEAFKKQAKKQAAKQIMKVILKVIIAALAKMLMILLPIIIVVVIISAIIAAIFGGDSGDSLVTPEELNETSLEISLVDYLRQFSHTTEAPQTEDGRFYKMYGDGAGWPTIGNSDLQWKSHYPSFECKGKVLKSDGEYTEENVAEYVENFLTRGHTATYTDEEIDAMEIYIEKELVDQIGGQVAEASYQSVLEETEGLNLSQQQLYALTTIKYNFGHLPTRNGYTFKEVYEEGAGLYEINSWEHNKHIWDKWWSKVGGGYAGHVPARDAAFETYVKGIYDFTYSDAGEVFGRSYYIYYTQEQLEWLQNNDMEEGNTVPDKEVTRTSENEEEIFTYEENGGFIATSDVAEFALQFEGEGHSRFTSYTIPEGIRTFYGNEPSIEADWCAMFVSYCYYNCGLIPDVLSNPFRGCEEFRLMDESRRRTQEDYPNYVPKSGDIIFYDWENDGSIDHTGIVVDCDGIKVYTIEGNTGSSSTNPYWKGSKVERKERNIDYSKIYGYYSL